MFGVSVGMVDFDNLTEQCVHPVNHNSLRQESELMYVATNQLRVRRATEPSWKSVSEALERFRGTRILMVPTLEAEGR